MNSRIRRVATAAVASLAGLALLAGCANPLAPFVGGAGADEQKAPITDGVPEELLPYYGQILEWGSCDEPLTSEPVECATVTAPLDWSAPQSGDIELSISRPADRPDDPRGSLLVNPGGPGASGVDMLHSSLEYGGFGEPLLDTFDVVGFDPRGVARSTPVTCLDAQGMDAYLYGVPEGERGSSEWEKSQEDSAQTFAEACESNTGEELEFITTEQAARDMDLLRALLGDTALDYLGYSYGTYLGATYAELFPDKVGRFVLDGALDPSVSGGEVGRVQVIAFEQSLRAYLQTCLDGSSCPFRGSVDQAMDEVASLLAALDRRPLAAPDGRELGGDTMMTAVVAALYSEENWPYLTEAFAGALEGDPTPALFLADFYNGREQGVYTSNSTEAFNAYNCMDYPTESDAQWERDKEILQKEAPVTWKYMMGADVCEFWPYPPSGEREAIAADGAPPIVVIGTTGDPATPFAWAESLADQLSSGVLVAKEGEGHTAYQTGSSCIDDAVEGYLVEGTVPEDGLACQMD
ncbi:alpha/beta hydrolase [Microbacterium sp. G2-8]|uniref:alpha/beta hydrolase n=1 Tax=Microbacterium sp. G2-8 TaxID=2842454 RepID=UPI001C8993BA|nr:alpha/beta hydrolase [Microbacterium sp. G2-8]